MILMLGASIVVFRCPGEMAGFLASLSRRGYSLLLRRLWALHDGTLWERAAFRNMGDVGFLGIIMVALPDDWSRTYIYM